MSTERWWNDTDGRNSTIAMGSSGITVHLYQNSSYCRWK